MNNVDYITYLFLLIILFAGVLFWAFGRKRKKRFEADAKIPFQD